MTSRTHTPEDVRKIIEPWSPVSIGVDITEEGTSVIGIYAMSENTSQIFYAKHYPAPQRTWVGLTDEEKASFWTADQMTQEEWDELFVAIEAKLKEKNT
jgi:hypothetical protein